MGGKKGRIPKVVNSVANLEAEIGHLVVDAEIKGDIEEWLRACDGNIERCLVIWVARDTGKLRLFGTNMKCVDAIGYLEVAKSDLLDYIYEDDNEDGIDNGRE